MITHFRTTQSSLLRHTIKCGDVKKVVTSKKVKGFRDTPPPPFPCGGLGLEYTTVSNNRHNAVSSIVEDTTKGRVAFYGKVHNSIDVKDHTLR